MAAGEAGLAESADDCGRGPGSAGGRTGLGVAAEGATAGVFVSDASRCFCGAGAVWSDGTFVVVPADSTGCELGPVFVVAEGRGAGGDGFGVTGILAGDFFAVPADGSFVARGFVPCRPSGFVSLAAFLAASVKVS